jgi:hypothetical protein
MKRTAIPAAVVAGLALGGAGVWAFVALGPGRPVGPNTALAGHFGQGSLARVSLKFVRADSREQYRLSGASFRDRPTPWGDILCEVRTYRVPTWIGGRRPKYEDHPLSLVTPERMYLVEMDAKGATYDRRARDCAKPLDARQVVHGNGLDIEWAAEALDDAARRARRGAVPLKVTCVDARNPPGEIACDGMDLLRQFRPIQITQVWPDQEGEPALNAAGVEWTHYVFMNAASFGSGCGQSEVLLFKLIHGPLRTSPLGAIEIVRDRIC